MKISYYWQVAVQMEFLSDNGKVQKVKENYLVDAMTGTEAEAKTYKELEQTGQMSENVQVTALKQSNIIKVIS